MYHEIHQSFQHRNSISQAHVVVYFLIDFFTYIAQIEISKQSSIRIKLDIISYIGQVRLE